MIGPAFAGPEGLLSQEAAGLICLRDFRAPSPRPAALLRCDAFSTATAGTAAGSEQQRPTDAQDSAAAAVEARGTRHMLYRGRGIRLFRLLVRFKVAQLTGIAALAVPITTVLSTGELSLLQGAVATSLLVGSGVASTTLWYYSRRYVGELSLLRATTAAAAGGGGPPPRVRFSVLDFWGNREVSAAPGLRNARQQLCPHRCPA